MENCILNVNIAVGYINKLNSSDGGVLARKWPGPSHLCKYVGSIGFIIVSWRYLWSAFFYPDHIVIMKALFEKNELLKKQFFGP